MDETQADRAEAPLRAGVYGRLSETYDAAESVPTQLDRGAGHATGSPAPARYPKYLEERFHEAYPSRKAKLDDI